MKTNLRILSLWAGVQSTTLALMIEKGEVPMVDCAIFADVGAEPQLVYDHLEYLKTQLSYPVYKHLDWLKKKLSYPVYQVSWRDLKQDILDASTGKYKAFTAPFFTMLVFFMFIFYPLLFLLISYYTILVMQCQVLFFLDYL